MTEIDFYVLDGTPPPDAQLFACRLLETVVRRGAKVHVHVADEAAAHALDECLWSFSAGSFVPHRLVGSAGRAPVWIGWQPPAQPGEVLLTLTDEVPHFFSGFRRVLELVPADEPGRARARERYRFYRERGYRLRQHKLGGGA
ncbi:DNA polymerase III subunit chi [Immundisolibacter sp.]|uniref:DNA polymerase III subunit chi n=1 Tax=Immundisolibacter sp. TaxID=1934948 RepID=UPI002627A0E1|nr:DNA polymerase III subunit chi [Immundisolibacter sp.]MDD3649872.1 DNA polymerase III subunit chi [Immundisolibacter sp.]